MSKERSDSKRGGGLGVMHFSWTLIARHTLFKVLIQTEDRHILKLPTKNGHRLVDGPTTRIFDRELMEDAQICTGTVTLTLKHARSLTVTVVGHRTSRCREDDVL